MGDADRCPWGCLSLPALSRRGLPGPGAALSSCPDHSGSPQGRPGCPARRGARWPPSSPPGPAEEPPVPGHLPPTRTWTCTSALALRLPQSSVTQPGSQGQARCPLLPCVPRVLPRGLTSHKITQDKPPRPPLLSRAPEPPPCRQPATPLTRDGPAPPLPCGPLPSRASPGHSGQVTVPLA